MLIAAKQLRRKPALEIDTTKTAETLSDAELLAIGEKVRKATEEHPASQDRTAKERNPLDFTTSSGCDQGQLAGRS
jgi:hypothetical protein